MKNKIKELMVITTNSKTVEDFKKNFKKGYLELLDFDEINRLNKEEDRLYNSCAHKCRKKSREGI